MTLVGQELLYEALIKIHTGSFFSVISLWLYKNSKEYNLGTQIQKQPVLAIPGIYLWKPLPLGVACVQTPPPGKPTKQ